MQIMRRHLAPVAALAAALAFAAPAAAVDGARATLSATPKRLHRGDHYTLRGRGWDVNVRCRPTVTLKSSRGQALGSAQIKSDGSFAVRRGIRQRAKKGRYAVTATQACEGGPTIRTVTLRII
jgi:hypothetical protein